MHLSRVGRNLWAALVTLTLLTPAAVANAEKSKTSAAKEKKTNKTKRKKKASSSKAKNKAPTKKRSKKAKRTPAKTDGE